MKNTETLWDKAFSEGNISKEAKILFLMLLGIKDLLGKNITAEQVKQDCFIELSEAGYILGSPTKYSLNKNKLSAEILALKSDSEASDGPVPSMMDLVSYFKTQHLRFRDTKPKSNQKSLVQLRLLTRLYSSKEVKSAIIPFFHDNKVKQLKGQLTIGDFYNWAIYHLKVMRKNRGNTSN
jgi:hypothetical protein